MSRLFASLRFRLIVFVLLASLPALALTLYNGIDARKHAALEAQQDALRLVRFTAVNHALLIENTRGFLLALSHSMASRDGNLQNCGLIFSHMLQNHFPYYSAFYIADLQANVLCAMLNGDVPDDLQTCEHYQELVKSEDFVISQYHICRNTGKAVISMGYPVRDASDNKIAVINVSIDLAFMNQMAASADMPPGSTQTVLDKDGVVLAHYPDPESMHGEVLGVNTVLSRVPTLIEGTIEGPGPDGVNRLYAYVPLEGTQNSVFVSIGIPTDVAYAAANRSLASNLALLGVVTLLALGAAWLLSDLFVLRQTQTLVQATRELARGNLTARANISYEAGEIGQLAQAFDQMADALHQRDTESKRAEAEIRAYAENLERSNRDLQDFANIASHDLQEPLRKIQTFSELLQIRYNDCLDERGRDYLLRMYVAAHHLQELTQDLLTFSRISTRAEPVSSVDMNEVIHQVLGDLDVQIEETGARVDVDDLPVIEADPTQMRQLLQNLISNAIKFHKPGQPAVIQVKNQPPEKLNFARSHNGQCQIFVCDNGIGFDEKYLDRIFQPFQRLHGKGDDYPGTGMGLAICRKIVERHGGSLSAHSTPGEGATFVINMPCKQP